MVCAGVGIGYKDVFLKYAINGRVDLFTLNAKVALLGEVAKGIDEPILD